MKFCLPQFPQRSARCRSCRLKGWCAFPRLHQQTCDFAFAIPFAEYAYIESATYRVAPSIEERGRELPRRVVVWNEEFPISPSVARRDTCWLLGHLENLPGDQFFIPACHCEVSERRESRQKLPLAVDGGNALEYPSSIPWLDPTWLATFLVSYSCGFGSCDGCELLVRSDVMAGKKKKKVEVVFLVCDETGDYNYTLRRRSGGEKLKLSKYSPRLRRHTLHTEKKK